MERIEPVRTRDVVRTTNSGPVHGFVRMNALFARCCATCHTACGRWRRALAAAGPHRDLAMMLSVAGI